MTAVLKTSPYNKQKGFSFFGTLLLLIVAYFAYSYIVDGGYKDMSAHAADLREKLEDFASQKGVAQQAYNDAISAKDTAVNLGLTFKNEKTQTFISKWQNAENEVSKLKDKLEGIDRKAEMFFIQIDGELDTIQDQALRNKMDNAVEMKAQSFAQSLKKTKQAIAVLETSIKKGADIITAIKISGALGSISAQITELDILAQGADSKFAEIDALVAEGMDVLNIELN